MDRRRGQIVATRWVEGGRGPPLLALLSLLSAFLFAFCVEFILLLRCFCSKVVFPSLRALGEVPSLVHTPRHFPLSSILGKADLFLLYRYCALTPSPFLTFPLSTLCRWARTRWASTHCMRQMRSRCRRRRRCMRAHRRPCCRTTSTSRRPRYGRSSVRAPRPAAPPR